MPGEASNDAGVIGEEEWRVVGLLDAIERHGQDCSEIEGEDHQDKEGWEARVGNEAQDRSSPAHDRCASRQVSGGQEADTRSGERDQAETCGSEAHRSPQADGRNSGCRTCCDSGQAGGRTPGCRTGCDPGAEP
jgi:hypothetical protein